MGKQLQRRVSYGVHPHSAGGCFWGMFNVLDYHHWNYVKKLLHHKKHHGRRRLQCFATPKTVSFSFHGGEEHVDGDSEHLLGEHRVDQDNTQKPSSSKEASNKNRKRHRRNSSIISNQTNQIMIFHENAEDPYICFEEHSNSDHKNAKFTKARSFPVPDGSGRGYGPSTMNHKQNEVWFFPKVTPLKIVTLETSNHNSEPTRKDASHGWNHLVKSQFKGFKKIIKRALQETRKETKKSSSKRKEESTKEKSNVRQMTRLSSLNESADKYARLFDRSFSGNATSKSLKLSFEDDKVGGDVAKSYRRRHSLPDYETLISLLGEVSQETLYSGLLAWTKSEIEKSKESRPSFDIKGEQIAESGPRSADLGIETDRCQETVSESGKTETAFDFDDEKIATVENKALDQGAFLSFEGAELASWSPPNLADPIKLHHDPGSVKEIDPDFKFVSDILKSAGFIETETIPPWDSIELPLNPQLFDELEAPKPHDLECRDHQLLFDLINEALLEIYERSFSYFPRPFAFSPYTRPITKGKHVLDEVWKTVKGYTSTRLLECDWSLDDVVARDMAKRDGWMSLEWDCECLAVELEDSILNELIDELVYS